MPLSANTLTTSAAIVAARASVTTVPGPRQLQTTPTITDPARRVRLVAVLSAANPLARTNAGVEPLASAAITPSVDA
jgi:hypothetical protein